MKNKKNHWLTILLSLTTLVLILSAIISILTPKKIEVSLNKAGLQNVDFSNSDFEDVVFEGDFNLPTGKFNIYSYQQKNSDMQQLISTLEKEYQLEQSSYSENIYLGSEYTLSHSPVENLVTLSLNQASTDNGFVERTQALSQVTDFLTKTIPDNQYDLLDLQTKYYSSQGHLDPSSPLNATLIEFQFFYQLDDYPVFMAHAIEAPIKIMVNNQLQIQKAAISPVMLALQPIEQRSLISIQTAVDNINHLNLGSLIRVIQEKVEPVALTSINSGVLKEVGLEYRTDPINNLIYPFYKFEGEFANEQNEVFWAYLITPAIAVKIDL